MMKRIIWTGLGVLTLLCAVGCSNMEESKTQAKAQQAAAGKAIKTAFLTADDYPNPLLILPAPPEKGSAQDKADRQIYKQTLKQKGTPQWERAKLEESQKTAFLASYFSKAMGTELSKEATPATYALMSRLNRDAQKSTAKVAKNEYKRVRPYVVFNQHTCSLDEEESHRQKWSYPSAHATLGWMMALVLSEINPARQNELLSLGYQYGQNRVICGYHWQSDVDAGRFVAGYAVARLHADPKFAMALKKAKAELEPKLNPKPQKNKE